MKKYPLQILCRPPLSSDLDLIYSTFIRSLNNQYPWRAKKIIDAGDPKRIVRDGIDKNYASTAHHSICTRLLKNCSILVACDPTDEDQTFGYVIFKDNTLFWVYSKYDFRKAGVATRLMEQAFENFKKEPIEYAIPTASIHHLRAKWNLEYNSHKIARLGRDD